MQPMTRYEAQAKADRKAAAKERNAERLETGNCEPTERRRVYRTV